jgi:hypothetical protein
MWCSVGKSIIGTQHQRAGLQCQDANGASTIANRRLIALADGAGSAKYGQQGSSIAVNTILGLLTTFEGPLNQIDANKCSEWLGTVVGAIAATAKQDNAELSDYATTLLFAAFEGSEAYFWQIGDGCWVVDTGDTIEAATWPKIGEYVNETVFVTSTKAADEWTHAYYSSIESAIGFTDGLEHLCLDFALRRPHIPFVGKIFAHLNTSPEAAEIEVQLEQLLRSELVEERTDDDRTMVVAWRNRQKHDNQ